MRSPTYSMMRVPLAMGRAANTPRRAMALARTSNRGFFSRLLVMRGRDYASPAARRATSTCGHEPDRAERHQEVGDEAGGTRVVLGHPLPEEEADDRPGRQHRTPERQRGRAHGDDLHHARGGE